ncbi:MAG: HEAT repeat domain-containing protein, partial [Cyanobium sp.]
VISVRSAVIEALGRIGDGRALGPLAGVLASQLAHARVTLEALQALGPLASGQAGLITAVLDARIADRPGRARACRLAVLALDQDLARRAVVERLERQHPERTRHVFQNADVAAALRTLDRRSPEYLKHREGVCRDAVAEAALKALAAIRCASCLPPIVSALREPWLATAAAWELGRIRPLPPAAAPALRAVISSPSHGPLARESARVALADSGG